MIYKKLWAIKVIPSTQCLAWRVMLNKIFVKEQLKRRGCRFENELLVVWGE